MSSNKETHVSRRDIVGVAVAATAAAGSVAAAQTRSGPRPPGRPGPDQTRDDPTSKYPKPPFARQLQPWPGLTSKMSPVPDHGEKSYKGSGRLVGRKALITGGDSGMGRACAIAFAREGADVAINYLEAEEPDAREVMALIRDAGRKGVAIPGDIRQESFCRQLVQKAADGLGGLDILVMNAGRQQSHESILDISTEQFDWTMKTNIYAPFWIIKAALPLLKPGSAIIGTTSIEAEEPDANLYDYAQTKAATTNYIKSLAKQLGPKGIRVNGVAPGPIWTPLQVTGGQTQEKLETFGQNVPSADRASPQSWRRFTCNWQRPTRATRAARYLALKAAGR